LNQHTASAAAPHRSLESFLAAVELRAFRYAEVALRQREDALDVVQEAMERMLDYSARPAAEWTPLFWSILRRRVIDVQRRRRFRLRFWVDDRQQDDNAPPDWADLNGISPEADLSLQQGYARLQQALRGLPDRQREAFTLRVLQELDGATTATVMGCSEGAVKTHLSRARHSLSLQLEDLR
jgi:RNA polymerase sigma-70 factor (ECF subfamily)